MLKQGKCYDEGGKKTRRHGYFENGKANKSCGREDVVRRNDALSTWNFDAGTRASSHKKGIMEGGNGSAIGSVECRLRLDHNIGLGMALVQPIRWENTL